jgi:hypothetical protein
MDEYRIRMFFYELIRLSLRYNYTRMGSPVSGLIEQMCLCNEPFVKRIAGDKTKESHEFRLNEAGLKMLWRVHKDHLIIKIAGDQVDMYEGFVEEARKLVRRFGFVNPIEWRNIR